MKIDMRSILSQVEYVKKYQEICTNRTDLPNRLRGNQKRVYDSVFNKIGYQVKYVSNGSFYRYVEKTDRYEFSLHLVLKGGIVEPLMFIKIDGETIKPNGRMDFWPEDMGIEFDRSKYNLPVYSNEYVLEEILRLYFSLFFDIKQEVLRVGMYKK